MRARRWQSEGGVNEIGKEGNAAAGFFDTTRNSLRQGCSRGGPRIGFFLDVTSAKKESGSPLPILWRLSLRTH
eukprot:768790-Hanusia_phi.AAC.2